MREALISFRPNTIRVCTPAEKWALSITVEFEIILRVCFQQQGVGREHVRK